MKDLTLADELERLAREVESDHQHTRAVGYQGIVARIPAILSALRGEWQGIATAPKGAPGLDVGTRDASEWFLGFARGRMRVVRRRAWPQDDGWEDQYGTNYAPSAFTHWRSLPPPPKGQTDE